LAKKKAGKPRREVTKRQLSRWQQQKRRQRLIFGLGIFIIVAVFTIIGTGWYIAEYRPMHQIVIRVNDTEFDMDYYVRMLKYYGKGQSPQYMRPLADKVVDIIEKNELVRQGAERLGISVSKDEIDKELSSHDLPSSKDFRDVIGTQLLLKKLRDEYFDKQVPVFAKQRHVMGMLLESKSQADEVRARLEAGEDFTELAGELSLESFSKAKKGDLGWQPEGLLTKQMGTSVPDEYAFNAEVGVLSQPIPDEEISKMVGYWLIKVLKRDETAQQAYVKLILLGSEDEAQRVRARLEAGESFSALANEFSQHSESKENGGQLDIASPDMVSPAVREFVFDPKVELDTLSQPIRDDTVTTKGGYWLLKVVDADDHRQIEDNERELMKNEALNEWVKAQVDNPDNKVESYLDDEKKAWAIERASGS